MISKNKNKICSSEATRLHTPTEMTVLSWKMIIKFVLMGQLFKAEIKLKKFQSAKETGKETI